MKVDLKTIFEVVGLGLVNAYSAYHSKSRFFMNKVFTTKLRQTQTLREFGIKYAKTRFVVVKIKVACSSGTYMRSLANRIGQDIGIPAFAYSIKRNRVNGYMI